MTDVNSEDVLTKSNIKTKLMNLKKEESVLREMIETLKNQAVSLKLEEAELRATLELQANQYQIIYEEQTNITDFGDEQSRSCKELKAGSSSLNLNIKAHSFHEEPDEEIEESEGDDDEEEEPQNTEEFCYMNL